VLLENGNDPNKPAIFILPEGALTSGNYVLRFYLGAFLSDLPVQLITIRYKIWGTTPLHHISSGHIGPVWSLRVSRFVPRADQQRPTDWVWPRAASSSFPHRSFFPHSPRRCVSSRLDVALLSTRITSVIIHRNVRVLCSSCFSFCKSFSLISFECASELIRIESGAFDSSSFESITISHSIQFIDGSAFASISRILIWIISDNSYFVVKSYFILGPLKATLNRYFGDASQISISRQIQVIYVSCFAYCKSLSSVSLEIDSELICIKSNAFSSVLRSNQPRFLVMSKFFVQAASVIVNHFHQFHLRETPN
jgi:hypothetical protein